MAQARQRAASARLAGSRSKSASTIRSKEAEVQREEKRANDAEVRIAKLQGQLAKSQQDLFKAEATVAKERQAEQAKATRKLELSLRSREDQFRPGPRTLGPPFPTATPRALAGLTVPPAATPAYDVFISHASEDKAEIARPLADRLEAEGVRVWFDAFVLTIGDSLRQKIDEGLAASRYGLVILSPSFFEKDWPQAELDGLYGRQTAGQKVILPIWHRISKEEVAAASPLLAGLRAFKTAVMTLDEIVAELVAFLRPESEVHNSKESA